MTVQFGCLRDCVNQSLLSSPRVGLGSAITIKTGNIHRARYGILCICGCFDGTEVSLSAESRSRYAVSPFPSSQCDRHVLIKLLGSTVKVQAFLSSRILRPPTLLHSSTIVVIVMTWTRLLQIWSPAREEVTSDNRHHTSQPRNHARDDFTAVAWSPPKDHDVLSNVLVEALKAAGSTK